MGAATPLRAIGLIRRELPSNGIDLYELAQRHGYRVVHLVALDTSPAISGLIVTHHVLHHGAAAVVVPRFEHAESIRTTITDLAALITPIDLYPRGYQWPATAMQSEKRQ